MLIVFILSRACIIDILALYVERGTGRGGHPNETVRVGILGAMGLNGQLFTVLLKDHPGFQVKALMASARPRGKKIMSMQQEAPDLVFSSIDVERDKLIRLEEKIAGEGIPVILNKVATRCLPNILIIVPKLIFSHTNWISAQRTGISHTNWVSTQRKGISHTNWISARRKRLNTKGGFIGTILNCSLQTTFLP
ncbi:MAG: hypothetical protein GX838_01965 [Clostridiaceae bacterium]|nr:hypothetical protein [Clostridiaceae bacterium]